MFLVAIVDAHVNMYSRVVMNRHGGKNTWTNCKCLVC